MYCFAKANRILKRPEFLNLSRIGKKARTKSFMAIFYPNSCGMMRLGITVTKKVGNAVTRNRIKRFVREYFRLMKNNITGFWDINIIAHKNASNMTSSQTFSDLQNIFQQISRSQSSKK